jgi:hypothetical protein
MLIVRFGRALSVLHSQFLELGDASFHESIQQAIQTEVSRADFARP